MRTVLFLALAALPPAAAADGDAGCEAARADADAERALLVAPELFGRVGVTDGPTAAGLPGVAAPALRLSAGIEYSLARLRRGLGVGDRALAACRRARAEARLALAVGAGEILARRAADAARARVLDALLPEGERIVADVTRSVKEARATVDELDAARLRLDGLRAAAAETAAALGAVPATAEEAPIPALLAEWRAADGDLAGANLRLRATGAWDLSFRGGYDQLLDGRQDFPLFAMLTLTYNLGDLFRRRADSRSRRGPGPTPPSRRWRRAPSEWRGTSPRCATPSGRASPRSARSGRTCASSS